MMMEVKLEMLFKIADWYILNDQAYQSTAREQIYLKIKYFFQKVNSFYFASIIAINEMALNVSLYNYNIVLNFFNCSLA